MILSKNYLSKYKVYAFELNLIIIIDFIIFNFFYLFFLIKIFLNKKCIIVFPGDWGLGIGEGGMSVV
jgi:hypothetical protein